MTIARKKTPHGVFFRISSRARSILAFTSAISASAFFDLAKKPMLFSSRPISCSSWRTLP